MSVITKGSVSKGQVAQFTLNKTALASLVSSTYYSNTLNWKKVVIKYKSNEGNQSITVTFDATQESPVGDFLASERALDNFEIISIQIFDFDNGSYKIKRESLSLEEFDVDLSGVVETVWPEITNSNYEIDENNQLVSLIPTISYDASNAVYLGGLYTRGSRTEVIFNLNENFFSDSKIMIAVQNTSGGNSGIFANKFGVNGGFYYTQSLLKATKTEFKMILTPTSTEFYLDGVLKNTLGAISLTNNEFRIEVRFPQGSIIESYSVTEL